MKRDGESFLSEIEGIKDKEEKKNNHRYSKKEQIGQKNESLQNREWEGNTK